MNDLKQGYQKTNTFNMLKELLTEPMLSNLRQIQKDELKVLDNKHTKKIILSKTETNYLKMTYQNFVLNNFKFEDKITKIKKTLKVNRPQHIGLSMLNKL